MTSDEYEEATLARALEGDYESGREALRLCREGLDAGTLSARLAEYLSERLWMIDCALGEAEALRAIKGSSGSVRSARDAAIAEALCIKRPANRPENPLPDWKVPYAALGMLLLKAGLRPEKVKASMDDARRHAEGTDQGLDRREAERILVAFEPMRALDDDMLLLLAGPLRDLVPTFLPQKKEP